MSETVDATKPFQVFPYDDDVLVRVFAAVSPTPSDQIRDKPQLDYFRSYFGHFKARGPLTVVVEWKYTDRDYLEDFAAYYVRLLSTANTPRYVRGSISSASNSTRNTLRAAIGGDLPELLQKLQSQSTIAALWWQNRYRRSSSGERASRHMSPTARSAAITPLRICVRLICWEWT